MTNTTDISYYYGKGGERDVTSALYIAWENSMIGIATDSTFSNALVGGASIDDKSTISNDSYAI